MKASQLPAGAGVEDEENSSDTILNMSLVPGAIYTAFVLVTGGYIITLWGHKIYDVVLGLFQSVIQ